MKEKILSYKGTGVAEMVVCRKTFSSYTVVGEAILEVCIKKHLSYTVRREAEKGVSARKKISPAEHGRCGICANCTKVGFRKKRLECGKMAVLGGVFRYNQRITT